MRSQIWDEKCHEGYPMLSSWVASANGCEGVRLGPLDVRRMDVIDQKLEEIK